MAKVYSEFVCQQCGFKSSSFLGKCPECGEWNSLIESSVSEKETSNKQQEINISEKLVKLSSVKSQNVNRIGTGFGEFDRVLGGGIVKGSIVLISGDPGIGKSTLLLQVAINLARGSVGSHSTRATPLNPTILYVTGEESEPVPNDSRLNPDSYNRKVNRHSREYWSASRMFTNSSEIC